MVIIFDSSRDDLVISIKESVNSRFSTYHLAVTLCIPSNLVLLTEAYYVYIFIAMATNQAMGEKRLVSPTEDISPKKKKLERTDQMAFPSDSEVTENNNSRTFTNSMEEVVEENSSITQQQLANANTQLQPVITHLTDKKGSFAQATKAELEYLGTAIKDFVGGAKLKSKQLKGGDVMVFPETNDQQQKLLKMKKCGSRKVHCSLPRSAQFQFGIIRQVPLEIDDAELYELLKDQEVTEVRRFDRQLGLYRAPTGTVKLTFNGSRPESISINGELYTVHMFFPRAFRCKKCWGLFHTQNRCNSSTRCVNCGSASHSEPTQCKMKCVNCHHTDHDASSNQCPAYLDAQRAVDFATRENISFSEARSKYCSPSSAQVNQPTATNTWFPPLPISDGVQDRLAAIEEEIRLIKQIQVPAALEVAAEAKALAESVDGKVDAIHEQVNIKIQNHQAFLSKVVDTLASASAQSLFDITTLLNDRLPAPKGKGKSSHSSPQHNALSDPPAPTVAQLKRRFLTNFPSTKDLNNSSPPDRQRTSAGLGPSPGASSSNSTK